MKLYESLKLDQLYNWLSENNIEKVLLIILDGYFLFATDVSYSPGHKKAQILKKKKHL